MDELILTKEQQENINSFDLKSAHEKNQYFQLLGQKLNILSPSQIVQQYLDTCQPTPEQVALVKEWLELGRTTSDNFDYEDVPQIVSANWEREILSQSL